MKFINFTLINISKKIIFFEISKLIEWPFLIGVFFMGISVLFYLFNSWTP